MTNPDKTGKNLAEVFDRMAPGWYGFRHHTIFRRELEILAGKWSGGRLLNIGCGHGADFLPFRGKFELHGLDFSAGMLKLAMRYSQKYRFSPDLVRADAAHLPYTNAAFDWAISVATYHHLARPEARREAFSELRRVLKPGGEAFITAWNRTQPRFWFQRKEVMVPWRTGGETIYRYYYLFTYPELENLARKSGFQILRSFPESSYRLPVKLFSRNICLLLRKDG